MSVLFFVTLPDAAVWGVRAANGQLELASVELPHVPYGMPQGVVAPWFLLRREQAQGGEMQDVSLGRQTRKILSLARVQVAGHGHRACLHHPTLSLHHAAIRCCFVRTSLCYGVPRRTYPLDVKARFDCLLEKHLRGRVVKVYNLLIQKQKEV